MAQVMRPVGEEIKAVNGSGKISQSLLLWVCGFGTKREENQDFFLYYFFIYLFYINSLCLIFYTSLDN